MSTRRGNAHKVYSVYDAIVAVSLVMAAVTSAIVGALTENDLKGLSLTLDTMQVLGLAYIAARAPGWLANIKRDNAEKTEEIKQDNAEKAEEIKTEVVNARDGD